MGTNSPLALDGWLASVNQPATSAMRCTPTLVRKLTLPFAPTGTTTRLARVSVELLRFSVDASGAAGRSARR